MPSKAAEWVDRGGSFTPTNGAILLREASINGLMVADSQMDAKRNRSLRGGSVTVAGAVLILGGFVVSAALIADVLPTAMRQMKDPFGVAESRCESVGPATVVQSEMWTDCIVGSLAQSRWDIAWPALRLAALAALAIPLGIVLMGRGRLLGWILAGLLVIAGAAGGVLTHQLLDDWKVESPYNQSG